MIEQVFRSLNELREVLEVPREVEVLREAEEALREAEEVPQAEEEEDSAVEGEASVLLAVGLEVEVVDSAADEGVATRFDFFWRSGAKRLGVLLQRDLPTIGIVTEV
jgi:hypothetical protein